MSIWFLYLLLALNPSSSAETILLKNAQIVDPHTRTIIKGHLSLEDDRVQKIHTTLPTGPFTKEFDLKNLWLVPAFYDMHTHSWGNDAPFEKTERIGTEATSLRMLYAGVAGFLDLGLPNLFEIRKKQRDGVIGGSRIFGAGGIFFYGKPDKSRKSHLVDSVNAARDEVKRFAKENPDVIKIIFDYRHTKSMPRKVLKAILQEAKRQNIKTVVHIGEWLNAQHAAEDGATAITHLCEDEVITDAALKAMKKAGVYSIPTMAVQLDMVNISERPELLDRPLLKELISKPMRDAYKKMKADPDMDHQVEWQNEGRSNDKTSLRKIYDAGIKLMTGSDAANYGAFQGYSVHREMEIFSEESIPNWEVLRSATTVPGEFLGQKVGFREGDRADFVVLKSNPIENIRATQDIDSIFFDGQKVDRTLILNKSFSSELSSASTDK